LNYFNGISDKKLFICQKSCTFANANKQMRIENMFVEPASESPLMVLDRAVYLAKNS